MPMSRQRTNDAYGYLAAVGYENLFHREDPYDSSNQTLHPRRDGCGQDCRLASLG